MTHNEKRTVWWKEGIASFLTGVLYGVSNVLVGHPLDTVKTKMQVVREYHGKSMISTMGNLYRTEGLKGFYKGCIPPLCGGSIFRAMQFAVFEALYTKWDSNKYMKYQLPFTFGLELRVILGGIASGTARAIIECPFEYSKVQRQTHQVWQTANIYQGFNALWLRSCGLMTTYFVLVDSFRRNTNAYKHEYGVFLMNGLCSTIGFCMIWPIEIAKNYIQSHPENKKMTVISVIKGRINEAGVVHGIFRGCVPGLTSVYIRNGAAMIVMLNAQKFLTHIGFRD